MIIIIISDELNMYIGHYSIRAQWQLRFSYILSAEWWSVIEYSECDWKWIINHLLHSLLCNIAHHFTRMLHFYSPSDGENMYTLLIK